MSGVGVHYLMEFYACDASRLNDCVQLETWLEKAAELAGATLIKTVFHQFSPQGVTGVVVVAESHLAIHTWPENGYAAVDFFTCNASMDGEAAFQWLAERLKSGKSHFKTVHRGTEVGEEVDK